MTLILTNRNMETLSGDIGDYPDGIILPIDKPYRWTSADVIRKIKFCACRHFHKKNLKVGHAGTLDPLATGVLLVCIGKATKLAEELQRHEKEYVAGISFGATTPSYDLEKEIDMLYPTDGVSEDALRTVLPDFLGEQEQVAPLFSAKSVDGVRAYDLARREWRRMQRAGQDSRPDDAHAASEHSATGSGGFPSAFDHSATAALNRQLINITEIELLRFCPDGVRDHVPPHSGTAGSGSGLPQTMTGTPGSSPGISRHRPGTGAESISSAENGERGETHGGLRGDAESISSAENFTKPGHCREANGQSPDMENSLSSTTNPDGSENLKNSRIHVADNSALHLPHAEIRVTCSKGTYIRALARDLGEALGSGAHIDSLRRTRTGGFLASNALSIPQAISLLQ